MRIICRSSPSPFWERNCVLSNLLTRKKFSRNLINLVHLNKSEHFWPWLKYIGKCFEFYHFRKGNLIQAVTSTIKKKLVSGWGYWSSCSETCGAGIRKRVRKCYGSGACDGSEYEREYCYTRQCFWEANNFLFRFQLSPTHTKLRWDRTIFKITTKRWTIFHSYESILSSLG